MQNYLYILLSLIGVGLIACTTIGINESTQQLEPATLVIARPFPSPTVLQSPLPMSTQLSIATATPTPTITAMPEAIPATAISETITTSLGSAPVLVATIQPDPYRRSFLPENVWWSEDSQILYYQDIEIQEAWAYDLSTGISVPITYVARSLRELEPEIQTTLPENASIVSLSPNNHYVLYRIPLPEPILISDEPTENPTPEVWWPNYFTAELWLHKDGQDFNLGLVDDCFGLLFSPLWSTNENVVIVNGEGVDGVACLHRVWLIDLETLSMGPLYLPFTEDYRVLDLSANGDVFLIRSFTDRLNYLYDSTTNEQWSIPVDDTDRMTMVEGGQSPHCLVFELEFSETILRDHVWYCDPVTGEMTILSTVEGGILHSVVSPDQKKVAFMVINDFPQGNFYERITPGIWLMALP